MPGACGVGGERKSLRWEVPPPPPRPGHSCPHSRAASFCSNSPQSKGVIKILIVVLVNYTENAVIIVAHVSSADKTASHRGMLKKKQKTENNSCISPSIVCVDQRGDQVGGRISIMPVKTPTAQFLRCWSRRSVL